MPLFEWYPWLVVLCYSFSSVRHHPSRLFRSRSLHSLVLPLPPSVGSLAVPLSLSCSRASISCSGRGSADQLASQTRSLGCGPCADCLLGFAARIRSSANPAFCDCSPCSFLALSLPLTALALVAVPRVSLCRVHLSCIDCSHPSVLPTLPALTLVCCFAAPCPRKLSLSSSHSHPRLTSGQ